MKIKYILYMMLCMWIVSCTQIQPEKFAPYTYEVSSKMWEESLGNHRTVLSISQSSDVVKLSFDWRRPDTDVDKHRFLIVHAESGDTVKNISRLHVDTEKCELLFGPVSKKGIYYFYYLPYKVQDGYGFYSGDYEPEEEKPETKWCELIKKATSIPEANIVKVESRTAFDSFYPMEIAATTEECNLYKKENPSAFWVFPEDRINPIRMKKKLPYKWLHTKSHTLFQGEALKNEYYTFQLGIWAGEKAVQNITYETKGLKSETETIAPEAITCFNLEGINPNGEAFVKHVDITKGSIQPLWFGIDIPENQKAGIYRGEIIVIDDNGNRVPVSLELEIKDKILEDRGDNDLWRHSRLRWLNSTLGISDKPTSAYENIKVVNNELSCLGRSVKLDTLTALPTSIVSWKNEILSAPIRFEIQTSQGLKHLEGSLQIEDKKDGYVKLSCVGEDSDLILQTKLKMEFDGWMNYIYTIIPKKELAIKDVRLVLPLQDKMSSYFMGIGLPGQYTPNYYKGKWNLQEERTNNYGVSIPVSEHKDWLWPFDSFWCGSVQAGLHCELRGSSYTGPLLNLYRPDYPDSWFNGGKGGFEITRHSNMTEISVCSGSRRLMQGDSLTFDFSFLITPVKSINYKSQFKNRYYHNGSAPTPNEDNVVKDGIKIINVHHANYLNPFINYPFKTVDKVRNFVDNWHKRGCKVKLYYTVRELSNVATEIWALRSLGNEILRGGNGGGFPWCREHLVTDYTPQWYQHLDNEDLGVAADASILTATGDSRWYNYYIEGLAWMVKHMDIDGLYLDDVAFGRNILQRMRRAMDQVKPGCLIDLHSNTGFSKGPAIQYAEFFPYVDKLWFGESFMYNEMPPENWLVEVSGLPFGLMGDMLHAGGNKWLGMQYGMTVRQPWMTEGISCDPRYIWRFWDELGIIDSQMNGFWEDNPIVKTSDKDVKVTSYVKEGKTLLSIGNYSEQDKKVKLEIDWTRLGLDSNLVYMKIPTIKDFQDEHKINVNDLINVPAKKGWLIMIQENK